MEIIYKVTKRRGLGLSNLSDTFLNDCRMFSRQNSNGGGGCYLFEFLHVLKVEGDVEESQEWVDELKLKF